MNAVRIAILVIVAGSTFAASACGDRSGGGDKSGSNIEGLLMVEVSLPESRYTDEGQRVAYFQEALKRISALPGVESAGAVSTNPLSDDRQSVRFSIEPVTGDAVDSIPAGFNVVSPGYFQTTTARLLEGRTLSESDGKETQRVVVINETLARRFFPDESAIGKRVQFGDLEEQSSWTVIVGVIADLGRAGAEEAEPEFYISYLQAPSPVMTIIVRAVKDAKELIEAVQREVKAVDGEVTISKIGTMK